MLKQIAGFTAASLVAVFTAKALNDYTGVSKHAQQAPAAYTLQPADTPDPRRGGERLTAIMADGAGHFAAAALVNGIHVEMIADTGASKVVLTDEDAQRVGFDRGWLDYNVRINTANGATTAARVKLDEVRVGQVRLENVDALIARPGDLNVSLLGMSFIGAISRFEMRGNQLVLVQ